LRDVENGVVEDEATAYMKELRWREECRERYGEKPLTKRNNRKQASSTQQSVASSRRFMTSCL
jgi:hypothetical protein